MKIEVIAVETKVQGKFRMCTVTYKGPDGKPEAKKIPSFKHPEVFKALSESKQGDIFEVKSEKSAEGYWEWTAIGTEGKNTGPSEVSKASQAARSTYETPEERAKKQVYIVRQSSLSTALELIKANKVESVNITPAAVIEVAKEFADYVFDVETVLTSKEVK